VKRILIIDDEEQIRSMLKIFFKKKGYEVETAADGRQGLQAIGQYSFDLVITDIIMPNKEGLETIRELRTRYADLKIIAMSGGGRIDPTTYLKMARDLGADHVFFKPIEMEELSIAVEQLLGHS